MIKYTSLIFLFYLAYACQQPESYEIQLSPEHFPATTAFAETDYQETTISGDLRGQRRINT